MGLGWVPVLRRTSVEVWWWGCVPCCHTPWGTWMPCIAPARVLGHRLERGWQEGRGDPAAPSQLYGPMAVTLPCRHTSPSQLYSPMAVTLPCHHTSPSQLCHLMALPPLDQPTPLPSLLAPPPRRGPAPPAGPASTVLTPPNTPPPRRRCCRRRPRPAARDAFCPLSAAVAAGCGAAGGGHGAARREPPRHRERRAAAGEEEGRDRGADQGLLRAAGGRQCGGAGAGGGRGAVVGRGAGLRPRLAAPRPLLPSQQKGVGMNEPLVDAEGFPRDDIDLYQVRTARHNIICEWGSRLGGGRGASPSSRREPAKMGCGGGLQASAAAAVNTPASTCAAFPVSQTPGPSACSLQFFKNWQPGLVRVCFSVILLCAHSWWGSASPVNRFCPHVVAAVLKFCICCGAIWDS